MNETEIQDPQDKLVRDVEDLVADHMARYRVTKLSPQQEERFQAALRSSAWFRGFEMMTGREPNLNDPDYDYRGAWLAGLVPQEPGDHWPSRGPGGSWLKSPTHPTAWMEYFMAATGIDPGKLGLTQQDFQRAVTDSMSSISRHPEQVQRPKPPVVEPAERIEDLHTDPVPDLLGAEPMGDGHLMERRTIVQPWPRLREKRDLTKPSYPKRPIPGHGTPAHGMLLREAERNQSLADVYDPEMTPLRTHDQYQPGSLFDVEIYQRGERLPEA